MSDDLNGMPDAEATAENPAALKALPMIFHAQFVRDLSFENPSPPLIHDPKGGRPVMGGNFSIGAVPPKSEQLPNRY